ncbi:MAG: hypothetical protein PHD40_04030 [Syntrophomonadaceae bacterium]|nr:hypothetical protein [Syntrophomonadaceae bacterium]
MKIVVITTNEPFPLIHLMQERSARLIAMTCAENENSQLHLFFGIDCF